jgi:hypothetical protein
MDDQVPYQKIVITVEQLGTGKTQKIVFYKTSDLLFNTEDIAEGFSTGVKVTMTMKSFALNPEDGLYCIEEPKEE